VSGWVVLRGKIYAARPASTSASSLRQRISALLTGLELLASMEAEMEDGLNGSGKYVSTGESGE
jgi:hypothetical protein